MWDVISCMCPVSSANDSRTDQRPPLPANPSFLSWTRHLGLCFTRALGALPRSGLELFEVGVAGRCDGNCCSPRLFEPLIPRQNETAPCSPWVAGIITLAITATSGVVHSTQSPPQNVTGWASKNCPRSKDRHDRLRGTILWQPRGNPVEPDPGLWCSILELSLLQSARSDIA